METGRIIAHLNCFIKRMILKLSVFLILGDKMETARNIAHSCRLFEAGMEVIPLAAKSAEALREILTHELNRLVGWTSPHVSPKTEGAGKRKGVAFLGQTESQTLYTEINGGPFALGLKIRGRETQRM